MLNARDVAGRLSTTEEHVYQLAREGVLPAVRVGRLVRFEEDALESWIAAGGSGYASGDRRPEVAT